MARQHTLNKFGGEGNSALIDDNIFAAFENSEDSKIKVDRLFGGSDTYKPDLQGYLVSADAIDANKVLFAGQMVTNPADPEGPLVQKRAFCQDCDYIKWGAWGMRSSYQNRFGKTVTQDTHLGWWIAGDDVPANDIDTLQALGATAHYSGDAIGTVARKSDGAWNQYVATGNFDSTWKFAKRRGDFTISNFDGKTFGGRLHNPAGTSTFATKATDLRNIQNGIVTQANGKFVGPRPNQTPAGMIGNFQANSNNWKANGIYGGTQIPR